MMMKFEISNKSSGLVAGIYDGSTADEALDAYARDAGYKDFRDACSTTDPADLDAYVEKKRADMNVVEVEAE